MGGSGTLGIGMRHGDVFAAIKANVPAEVEHVSSRMYFPPQTVPADVTLPDPPIVVDYSAQNDGWSRGPRRLRQGHERAEIRRSSCTGGRSATRTTTRDPEGQRPDQLLRLAGRQEERVLSGVHQRLDQRPAALAGPARRQEAGAGQRVLPLEERRATRRTRSRRSCFWSRHRTSRPRSPIPTEATADVSLRRLQKLRVAPGATVVSGRSARPTARSRPTRGVRHHPRVEDHRGADHTQRPDGEVASRGPIERRGPERPGPTPTAEPAEGVEQQMPVSPSTPPPGPERAGVFDGGAI